MTISRDLTAITNLTFGGQGVDGTPFAGALKQLVTNHGVKLADIKRVSGKSSGAVAALMVALNYSIAEIEQFYMNFTVEPRPDREYCRFAHAGLEEKIIKIITDKYIHVDTTFSEMKEQGCKDLHIITTMAFKSNDSPTTKPHIFSSELSGDTRISDAVFAAASISGMYPMVRLGKTGPGKWEQSDTDYHHAAGGNISPEKTFDLVSPNRVTPNKETLGFITYYGVPNAEYKPIANNAELIFALLDGPQSHYDPDRTVLIDCTPFGVTTFAQNTAEKHQLLAAGTKAMENYSNPSPFQLNRGITRSPGTFFSSSSSSIPVSTTNHLTEESGPAENISGTNEEEAAAENNERNLKCRQM
jgi:hypothetical protein